VVCLRVISKPNNEEALNHYGCRAVKNEIAIDRLSWVLRPGLTVCCTLQLVFVL
jgi:hypothetical protein